MLFKPIGTSRDLGFFDVIMKWEMDEILKRKSAKHIIKNIFEITSIRLTMAEIKQFSIIQAITALWGIKDKEMASVSDWTLNFIKMNKIEIKLIQDSKNNNKFEFLRKFGVILNRCHFLNFDISESCKSLDNRELFYLCYG